MATDKPAANRAGMAEDGAEEWRAEAEPERGPEGPERARADRAERTGPASRPRCPGGGSPAR
jgi:hypothetical protein